MFKRLHVLVVLCFTTFQFIGQENVFKIYDAKGKKSSFAKMSKTSLNQDVVFFGELHNNPIAHWMEVEIAKFLLEEKKVTFGAEMFESNDQVHLDAFMKGEINVETFDSLAGIWSNFKTDYLPLVDLAISSKSKFIASNIPRKYASQVFKKGIESLDSLPAEDKKWIAPLPIDFDITVGCYAKMMEMMPGGHGGENFPKAQAIKDATMAHFIAQNMNIGEDHVFYHINGSFHSDNKEGIIWYLEKYKPGIRVMNISVVVQEDIHKLEKEHFGVADFIIVVDSDLTTSY